MKLTVVMDVMIEREDGSEDATRRARVFTTPDENETDSFIEAALLNVARGLLGLDSEEPGDDE